MTQPLANETAGKLLTPIVLFVGIGVGVWLIMAGGSRWREESRVKEAAQEFLRAILDGDAQRVRGMMVNPVGSAADDARWQRIDAVDYQIQNVAIQADATASVKVTAKHRRTEVILLLQMKRMQESTWKVAGIELPRTEDPGDKLFQLLSREFGD